MKRNIYIYKFSRILLILLTGICIYSKTGAQQCKADFYWSVCGKLQVKFSNYSQGGSYVSWNFGDGSVSLQVNPVHKYAVSGTYLVTLVIGDSASGCSDTVKRYIEVLNYYHIYGKIEYGYSGNDVSSQGKIWAMKLDTSKGTLKVIDYSETDATGKYDLFVTEGYYIVEGWLKMSSPRYNKFLPTYFPDRLHWDTALLIHVTSDRYGVNIQLVEALTPAAGVSKIAGTAFYGSTASTPGAPVFSMELILADSAKNPLGYIFTDFNGKFCFNNLAFGTYYIIPEYFGKQRSDLAVVLTSADVIDTTIRVYVNNYNIVSSSWYFTGADIVHSSSGISVYPNPASDYLYMTGIGYGNYTAKIYDITGREVELKSEMAMDKAAWNVSALKEGIYIIRISRSENIVENIKFIKK